MDGKKKKNRKKKGNQSKSTDDAAPNADAEVVLERVNGSAPEQNHRVPIPGNSDVQSIGVSESDIELERHNILEEKFVKLQEEVRHLEDDKSLWLRMEACLEEKIIFLQNKVESCLQKEANLEEKLRDIQIGNDALIQKQVILEDKIEHIESIKDSWNLKEVKQLQESRNNLVQENQQLTESISALDLRMQRLEREASLCGSSTLKITEEFPEEKNPLQQIEANHPTVDSLTAENAEIEKVADEAPTEKVNEPHFEPDEHAVAVDPSITEPCHDPSDHTSDWGDKIQSLPRIQEIISIHNSTGDLDAVDKVRRGYPPELDESRLSGDVVSVPLDDAQAREPGPVANGEGSSAAVPLSDAPLIGAPFRLISFVTRYVSGADLVNHNGSKSGQ